MSPRTVRDGYSDRKGLDRTPGRKEKGPPTRPSGQPFSRSYDLTRPESRKADLAKLRISAERLAPQARKTLLELREWPKGAPSCTHGPLNGGLMAALDQWGMVRREPDTGPLGGQRHFLTDAGDVVAHWLASGQWPA